MAPVTVERLREVLVYTPDDGQFRWRKRARSAFETRRIWRSWNTRYAGQIAASRRHDGYVRISIDRHRYLAHRLAWLFIYGEWPVTIDHINGDASDNRIANLRSVSQHENLKNAALSRKNTSGVTGVYWDKNAEKWHAQIRNGTTTQHIGLFDDIQKAADARKAFEAKLGFHPNHGRITASA